MTLTDREQRLLKLDAVLFRIFNSGTSDNTAAELRVFAPVAAILLPLVAAVEIAHIPVAELQPAFYYATVALVVYGTLLCCYVVCGFLYCVWSILFSFRIGHKLQSSSVGGTHSTSHCADTTSSLSPPEAEIEWLCVQDMNQASLQALPCRSPAGAALNALPRNDPPSSGCDTTPQPR